MYGNPSLLAGNGGLTEEQVNELITKSLAPLNQKVEELTSKNKDYDKHLGELDTTVSDLNTRLSKLETTP